MTASNGLERRHNRTWAIGALLILSACATGREPPKTTAMVPVTSGLVFRFGMDDAACGVTLPAACTDTSKAMHPGAPSVLVELKPFAIDRHEVTNEQYRHCVELGGCSRPAKMSAPGVQRYYGSIDSELVVENHKFADHPVIHVHAGQAAEYCKWVGKRLPSEFEWERVAAGPAKDIAGKQVYPWGPKGPRNGPGECGDRDIYLGGCTVRDHPEKVATADEDQVLEDGVTVYDLAGNVAEWTASDGDPRATCDMGQTYDCDDCLACRTTEKSADACKIHCSGCSCGADSSACFRTCGAPVCPIYSASQQPLVLDAAATNKLATRVVRGGHYAEGSGSREGQPCEGRSDHRGWMRMWNESDATIGFRCAKSL